MTGQISGPSAAAGSGYANTSTNGPGGNGPGAGNAADIERDRSRSVVGSGQAQTQAPQRQGGTQLAADHVDPAGPKADTKSGPTSAPGQPAAPETPADGRNGVQARGPQGPNAPAQAPTVRQQIDQMFTDDVKQGLEAIRDQHVSGRSPGDSAKAAMRNMKDSAQFKQSRDGRSIDMIVDKKVVANVPNAKANDSETWAKNLTTMGNALSSAKGVSPALGHTIIMRGITSGLDAHSNYMTPDQLRLQNNQLRGNGGSIG